MNKKSRKELLKEYKEIKTLMGVIQIKNLVNGKIYLNSYPNLKNKWLTLKAQLDAGKHMNSQLQAEWKEFGHQAFSFEVLEEKDTSSISDIRWEQKQMVKTWLDKLQPYGERGYHKPPQ